MFYCFWVVVAAVILMTRYQDESFEPPSAPSGEAGADADDGTPTHTPSVVASELGDFEEGVSEGLSAGADDSDDRAW